MIRKDLHAEAQSGTVEATDEEWDAMKRRMTPQRAAKLHVVELHRLHRWGQTLYRAFGHMPYQVGSSLTRADYRDIDVRILLPDEVYETLFPAPDWSSSHLNALRALLCEAISVWGQRETGLPIDFQFDPISKANEMWSRKNGHPRNAIGIGYYTERPAAGESWRLK